MKRIILLYIFAFVTNTLSAQTLDKKWNYMIEKSNSYNTHKIIKGEELNTMWAAVQDSLTMMRLKVRQEKMRIDAQASEIAGLNAKINASNTRYKDIAHEKDRLEASASSRDTYIATLWIIVGVVVAACAVLFLLYNKSNSVTNQKKSDYDQLLKSFEEYKISKLEVERKLKREIQTYMNKLEEMKIKM